MTRTDKRGLVVMRKTMKSKAGRRKELKQLWKVVLFHLYNAMNNRQQIFLIIFNKI